MSLNKWSANRAVVSRGKEFGHDVDFIVTTLELGMEKNLLLSIINRLTKQVSVSFSVYTSEEAEPPFVITTFCSRDTLRRFNAEAKIIVEFKSGLETAASRCVGGGVTAWRFDEWSMKRSPLCLSVRSVWLFTDQTEGMSVLDRWWVGTFQHLSFFGVKHGGEAPSLSFPGRVEFIPFVS